MNRIFKYALMFAFVGIAIFALSQMSSEAKATDYYWDGGGIDDKATTNENWVGDSAPPTGAHNLYFAGISSKDCTYDLTSVIDQIILLDNYTGTVTNTVPTIIYYLDIGTNCKFVNNNALTIRGYYQSILPNDGTITGTTKIIIIYLNNKDIYIGNCAVGIDIYSAGGSNPQLTLKQDIITSGRFYVWYSSGVSSSLDLNGFNLTCRDFLIGGTTTIKGDSGQITCSGNWDDTNGTFTPENSAVILTGSGYCHTDDPGTFYDLTLEGNTRFVHSVNVVDALILNGQWIGDIYYNGTRDIAIDQQHWTGWLYTQNDIAIEYNAYAYLAFQHDAWLGIQLESWSGTDNFTWNATSVASQTVQWSWSRGESSAMYDEYQDGIYIGSSETNAGGMGEFTNTFVGNHAFLLSRSSFLPASTDISDDVWLGIIFMSIATLITLFGYVRRIGLVMIISFLLLVIGTLASTQIWVELWTLPTLFILVNVVLMTHGLLRKV